MTDQLRPPSRPLSLPRLPLVGREDDVQQLLALARRPTTRLLTITGLGGIGKTRLAFELAARLADGRRPVVVELASVSEPGDVVPAVAEALELPSVGDHTLADVGAALDGQPTLLVLDNLEQIAGVGAVVGRLLAHAPDLLVVATSRVPVGIAGEHLWRTRPLGLPQDAGADVRPRGGDRAEEIDGSGAMLLFRSVAEAMDGRFVLDDDSRREIAAICRRLGGHPLAIELAAARLPHLGPAGLRRELERRSSTMFAASRSDAPDRHRDLAATIDWSYDQLDDASRRLFRQLGVWESWTTLDLIEPFADDITSRLGTVTTGVGGSSRDAEVLDALAGLVDHHLVEVAHDRQDSRYRLLPPVRDVALALLRDDPVELAAALAAHEACLHALARTTHGADDEPGGHARVPVLESLRPDLVVALDRAIAGRRATVAADLACALAWVWSSRRVFDVHLARIDHAAALQRVRARDQDRDPVSWASLHGWRLVLHATAGADASRLRELDRDRPPVPDEHEAEQPRHRQAEAMMLLHTLRAFVLAHAPDDAARVGEELLARTAGHDDRWRARAEALTGMVANLRGDHERAFELGVCALDRARRVGDDKTVVRAALLLGPLEAHRRAPVIDLAEAHAIARRLGDPEALDWLLPTLAIEAFARGDVATGARYCAESFGSPPWGGADQGTVCAAVLAVLAAGDAPAASARVHGMLHDRWRVVESHLLPAQRAAYHGTIAGVRERLGATAFEAAVADGAQLDWRVAVQEMHRVALRLAGGADDDSGPPAREQVDVLTARELEVLRLLATGATNKEISRSLSLSAKTVMHHTTAIYRKLGVRGRTEAAAVAHRSGLVPD